MQALDCGEVNQIITTVDLRIGSMAHSAAADSTPFVLRKIKRLTWFALVACVALIGTIQDRQDLAQQVSVRLALAIIVVACWAILHDLSTYLRAEEARRRMATQAARLEGARLTASAMQDRIANKLSLTVGYAEFLVTDPRLPDDLREHAQRAMDGARAAAEQMSELKRVTNRDADAQRAPQDREATPRRRNYFSTSR